MARSRLLHGRRPELSVALASACACAAVALFPSQALAAHNGSVDLGADLETPVMLAPSPTADNLNPEGLGFKIRVGDQFRLRHGIKLTPEVGYAYDHIFTSGGLTPITPGPGVAANEVATGDWNMNRVFGGLRLSFGRVITPVVYAHVGYGFRSISDPRGASIFPGSNGVTFDTGVAVDFHLGRNFSIGPHAEYVLVDVANPVGQSIPQWLALGGHVDFHF